MKKAYIKGDAYYLPKRVVTNEDLVHDFPEWNVEKIAGKIGVCNRHIAAENETAADMAVQAAEKLFAEHADIRKEEVDFVLFCTQSPDYFLPTSACIIQHRLQLSNKTGALDFNLGCSGYVYRLALAKGLIVSGTARNVLLLTAETYSKYIHPKDKGNRTIFGDAAAATLIADNGYAEIGNFSLGTDGLGAENLIVRSGASRQKLPLNDLSFDENKNPHSSDHLFMDGSAIFNFTLEAVPTLVADTLLANSLCLDNISLFIFHQANKYMLNFLRKKIGIDEERFFNYFEETGNTVSSTIPIALYKARQSQKLYGPVLLAGFGVGYSYAGVILNFNEHV